MRPADGGEHISQSAVSRHALGGASSDSHRGGDGVSVRCQRHEGDGRVCIPKPPHPIETVDATHAERHQCNVDGRFSESLCRGRERQCATSGSEPCLELDRKGQRFGERPLFIYDEDADVSDRCRSFHGASPLLGAEPDRPVSASCARIEVSIPPLGGHLV